MIARAVGSCLTALCIVLASRVVPLHAQAPVSSDRFLAKEDILLYGIGLHIDCNKNPDGTDPAPDENGVVACETVPKGFATAVPTMLNSQIPPSLLTFGPDAVVKGTLRGPSLGQPIELTTTPNNVFNIPILNVPGYHTLEDIRLVRNGEIVMRADRESVIIRVIDKLLVTKVTAKPLTAAEEREKGLVFDKSNFQAFNFTAAFAIQDKQVPVNLTVVLPTLQQTQDVGATQVRLPGIGSAPGLPSLQTIIPDTLKQLSLQIPNLSVSGFSLKMPKEVSQNFFVPPIPGVVVIPGDIGFLNQFFSVMLMVGNVAPNGSNLVVTDLHAEIVLPPGDDNVVGSPDDPLAMGKTDKGEISHTQSITQAGPDGKLGTIDDITTIAPGETGSAEFLVEGRREGTHVVEMNITGTLLGLPSGPVTVTGIARGAVLVRNPSFTLTFTHPEVVTAGEPYSLDVTVTNTSVSPANFVSLNLFPQFVTGATIVGDSTKQIESIAPGDSSSVSFDLIARVSGKVFATNLSSDENVAGRFKLKSSVGELGIPLSPDSLVLPKEARSLPQSLRDATLGLLGKAYAVATAPPAALPKDIARFSKKLVFDRAIDAAEAGLRVSLHEPIPDSALQLLMDFIGSTYPRLGELTQNADDVPAAQADWSAFDDLRRRSVRGDVFAQAVASLLKPNVDSLGAAAFHQDIATKIAYRPGHISVFIDSAAPLPVALTLVDAQNRRIGGVDSNGKARKEIPFSDFLQFSDGNGAATGELAIVAAPQPGDFAIRLEKTAFDSPDATFTLSVVVPDLAGNLRQLVFQDIHTSQLPALSFDSEEPFRLTVELVANGTPVTGAPVTPTASIIPDLPPSIVGAVQQAEADQICIDKPGQVGPRPGRVIAVLFSEEVTAASVQDRLSTDKITNYQVDANQVVSVALQPDRRIVYLALRDPIGPFTPRSIAISNVLDLRGHAMIAQPATIEPTVADPAGLVAGRVLRADGTPIPFANVRLFYHCPGEDAGWTGISSKTADANGAYSWDYVLRMLDRIVAIDPETDDSRDVQFNIGRDGQHLNVDIVMIGRGTVQGRTLDESRKPLTDTFVRISSLTDPTFIVGVTTDGDGRFTVARVPVGNILIEAVNTQAQAQVTASELIPFAGATIKPDLILLKADSPKQITVKKGTLTGHVTRTDNGSPAGLPVVVYYLTNSQPGVPCTSGGTDECAVAMGTADADGAFTFAGVPAGSLHVQSFDQTTLQQGDATTHLDPDGTASLTVILQGGLGKVTGVVLDPSLHPVAGARVGGGLSLTTTGADGRFTLDDVPLGHRQIIAVSDALQSRAQAFVDLVRAGDAVPLTLVLDSNGTVAGTIFHKDGTPAPNITAYLLKMDEPGSIPVVGQATSDENGHYEMKGIALGDKYRLSAFTADFSDGNFSDVQVKYNKQVVKADVTFRGGNGGRINGHLVNATGNTPLKGRVSISGDQPLVAAGRVAIQFEYVQNREIKDTNDNGEFSFGGLWPGTSTIRAAGVFSPDPIALEVTMPWPTTPVDVTIRLEPTSQIHGTVFLTDGVTPVGPGIPVHYHSTGVQVFCSENEATGETECITIPKGIQNADTVTQNDGTFFFAMDTAGPFTITIDDASGHPARVDGNSRPGETTEISARLPAVADVIVNVFTSDHRPVIGSKVEITQLDFPCPPDNNTCSNRKKLATTDGQGVAQFTGGDAIIEGAFVVVASDPTGNGYPGRAPGKVRQSDHGKTVTVEVFLYTLAGTVTGTVRRADQQPAPNAEVVISNHDGALSFGITDADGKFTLDAIPINKPFTVEVFDPVTAAHGSGGGTIFANGQVVDVFIDEDPLSVVTGHVVEEGTLAPLKGWQVTLSQTMPSGRAVALRATSSVDGSFSFPGTGVGPFVLSAAKTDVQAQATATGTVEHGGQAVDVSIVAKIQKVAFGGVEGIVHNADGSPAGDAQVDICRGLCGEGPRTTVTADHATGAFSLDQLPLGRVGVLARTQDGFQSGSALTEILFDRDKPHVDVTLAGLGSISGSVTFADNTPARSVKLLLTGIPDLRRDGFVNLNDGSFTFTDVSATAFTIAATDLSGSALKGAVSDVLHPGESKTGLLIVLQPTGSLSLVAQLENGNPASGIAGELLVGGKHFFAQTDAAGAMTFDVVPLGDYSLTLQDPLGIGVAKRAGTLVGPQSLGTVTLDSSRPVVAQITPAALSTGVPHDQHITIVFSEPIDRATADGNIVVSDAAGPVTGTVAWSAGDSTVTFTPLAVLKDQTKYNVRVVKDVADRVGHSMSADYVTSFTTADIAPPSILSIDPAPNTIGVNIFSPIGITFSEPIDSAKFRGPPTLTVTSPGGPVAGRLDMLFGGTKAVFTPDLPLADATTYHVQGPAPVDLAGNTAPQPIDFTFRTTDRTPPTITKLTAANGGLVIENTVTSVSAEVDANHDVVLVDFYLNDVFAKSASAPFTLNFQATASLGVPGSQIKVSAVPTDTSGTRGATPAVTFVTVVADAVPTIAITTPSSGASAANGQRVDVTIKTTDDVGVQQVSFRAQTGKPQDAATHIVSPAATDRSDTFGFNVPDDAVPGSSIVIEATVKDTKGQTAATSTAVAVTDAVAPIVKISGAKSGDQIHAGQQLTIIVSAQDAGGVGSIAFKATGLVGLNQTRAVNPAQSSVATSFVLTIPTTAAPGQQLTLEASAFDRAGNKGTATALLAVQDTVPPTVTSVRTSTGKLQITRGSTFTLLVDAEDETAISRIDLAGQGAFTVADSRQVVPPLGSATGNFTVQVPADAQPGSVLTLSATAIDLSGNVSAPSSLALTVIALPEVTFVPASVIREAGVADDVAVTLSDAAPAGGTRIDFATNPNVASVTSFITIPAGQTTGTLSVGGVADGTATIDAFVAGVNRGSMTATVVGGIVRIVVRDQNLVPVSDASVTVFNAGGIGAVPATAVGNGEYKATGLYGPGVVVKAKKTIDPTTELIGITTAQLNAVKGFANVDVVLLAAGVIHGNVLKADGAPAGAGVQVDLFESSNPYSIKTTFTDETSAYEFPLVAIGQYRIEASDNNGNRGRVSAAVTKSGEEVDTPIAFLGRGSVTIVVKSGTGTPISGADVRLNSFSIFGAAPLITRPTNPNGQAVFDNILIGSFSANTNDPNIPTLGGSIGGQIDANLQQVTKEIVLAAFGSVTGTVYRSDHVTTVPNATVILGGLTTTTDSNGHYAFAIVPLGTYTVSANDPATHAIGTAPVSVTQPGQPAPADVTLLAQGTLLITVKDANGNAIKGATLFIQTATGGASGVTGDGGLAIVDHITVGNFTVYALYNGLQGNASGTLAADEQHPVLVQLDPTAAITGTVKLPNDAPADGGTVYIDNSSISTPIAPDGTFTFDNLHLGTYTLSAYDAQGRLRARFKTPIVLSSLNQVATADMKFVGLGTVSGHVSYLSDPAQGVVVQIHALNPDFSLFRQTTTNGGGDYSVENIPGGEVAVSAANAALHLRAEGSGTIEHDAQPITVDLILQNNLIDLPTTRWDANNFTFDIQKDASILNGTNTVFAGIDTGQARGGSRLDVVVNGAVNHFTGSAFGTTESKGRQIVVRQDDVAGLNITRKVLVSNDGYFARYLEIVNNPTPDPITADLRVSTDIARNLFNSDASPSIIATSSGDNVLDVSDPAAADRWVVVDDVHPEDPFLVYSFPAVAEVFDGEGGAVQTTAAQLDPSDPQSFLGPRRLVHEWGSVTIPSNGTIALMHFLVQETSRPGAQAAAERLAQLPPEALAGLTGDDLAAIQNFDMPQGGVSTVAPLPSLTGIVSGTVRASNGAAVAGSITRFRSQNQLFGRTFQKTSGADGTFTFAGSFSDNGTSLPVPADAFTLTADHPNASGLITAQAAGQFEDGAAAAQQDVAFTTTGVASGVVRLNGAAVAGVQVTASAHIGSTFFNFSTPSAADGSFTFLLLPEGAFAFTSTVALPQGGAATGSSAAAIAAGQTAQTSIDIDTIPPQVTIVSPAPGASIDPRSPLAVIVHATDQIGVAQIVLQASGAATSSETRSIAPAATTRDEAFSVPFATLPPTGGTLTLSATATDRGGNHPASPTTMTLSVLDVVAPGVVSVSPASGAGEVEPTASLFVHFSEPIARGSITAASISLASGGVAVPVGYAFSDADATVVITPSQTLTLNRTYTLTVATAVTDAAGNHLAVPASSTFKTKSPDTIPPKVASIIPANGAVGVPVGSDIEVTFTEPIDRSTVTAASFRVTINAVPVAGRISFATNDALLRFVPDAPLPFDSVVVIELTSEITDLFQNGLVDANGNPLATPLTFTFLTGTFGITSPAQGTDVLEYSPLTLAAQATASLNITSVVFTVNGQALAPISGPPFTTTYNVGAAATTPALTISAVGRNASGAQVADDTVTVPVVVGLRVSPRILGVPHGGSAKLRLFLPSPIATDLSVQLATVDPNIATPSVASATIPAGQTEAVVTVNGASVGATTITASSSRGTAWAVASVSDPVAKTLGVNAAPTLVAVTPVRSLGRVFATTSGQQPVTVPLLASPATGIRTVGVTTTNPAVANVTAAVTVAAGSKTVTLPIVTGIAGTATLTVRSGDDVVQLTVVVGPPFDPVPPTFAAPVGVVTLTARSLGRVFTPTVGQTTIGVALLSTPATSSTPVTVTTSDANVVSVVGAVTVAAGSQVATVTLATGAQGTATLTFNAGGEVRQLTVVVGTPAPGTEPLVVARPVGVVVLQPRQTGNLFTAAGGQQNVNVTLLASPAVADMPVAIATTNSNVASVTGAPVVHAGERAAALNIITGVQGVATITLSAGGAQTQIVVVVGTPPAALVPIVIAPIVGVRVQQ